MTENFPVASWLLPRWSRIYVRAFYDFARRSDDIADDGSVPAEARRRALDALERTLAGVTIEDRSAAGDHVGLASAVASARVLRGLLMEAGLPVSAARDLLSAFRLDTEKNRWRDWDDLMDYCRLSAVPVGRFLLSLFGGARDGGVSVGALTSALQVLNHLQDVRGDYLDRGRIYLPADVLAVADCAEADLGQGQATAHVRRALDMTLDRTDALLDDAASVASDIHAARLGFEAAVILEIARQLSAKLRRRDPLAERVRLSTLEYVRAFIVGLGRAVLVRWLGDGGDAAARSVRGAKSSFFWGMRLLPREQRKALYAIYAFCRAVDDIADDMGLDETAKRAALDRWQADVEQVYGGVLDERGSPLARALVVPVRQFGLKKADFLSVIDGMRTDVGTSVRLTDGAAFALYCDRVAGAVGRLSNPVFGIPDDVGDDLARVLGRAMQTTNILRDLAEDGARNRLYLPLDLLARHGMDASVGSEKENVRAVLTDPRLEAALLELAGEAEVGFAAAHTMLARVSARTAAPVRVMMEVYRRLLMRLMRRGLSASASGPRLRIGLWERLWIALWYGVLHGR